MVRLVMSLKRGTSKNSEKVPYYFLCQQQNICILKCTDISLQILGCECSFSVQHAMLHIWAAEMPHSCISELLSVLLPGDGDSAGVPCLPLLSVFPAFKQIYMYFSLLWFFPFFFLFSFVSNIYMGTFWRWCWRDWGEVVPDMCPRAVQVQYLGTSCSPWCHWEALSQDAHCTFHKFPCGQTGCVWHSAV